jgi:hypothetical protein
LLQIVVLCKEFVTPAAMLYKLLFFFIIDPGISIKDSFYYKLQWLATCQVGWPSLGKYISEKLLELDFFWFPKCCQSD